MNLEDLKLAWQRNKENLGIVDEDSMVEITGAECLEECFILKKFLRENPVATIFDMEEQLIQIDRFIAGNDEAIVIFEIDHRLKNFKIDKTCSEFFEFLLGKEEKYFWRNVTQNIDS